MSSLLCKLLIMRLFASLVFLPSVIQTLTKCSFCCFQAIDCIALLSTNLPNAKLLILEVRFLQMFRHVERSSMPPSKLLMVLLKVMVLLMKGWHLALEVGFCCLVVGYYPRCFCGIRLMSLKSALFCSDQTVWHLFHLCVVFVWLLVWMSNFELECFFFKFDFVCFANLFICNFNWNLIEY